MGLFDGAAFVITEQGLDAAWYKQQIINHNISNITTPDYKAKTVNFGLILKKKMECPYHGNTDCPYDYTKDERDPSDYSSYNAFEAKKLEAKAAAGNDDVVWVNTTYETNTNQILNGNNVDIEKEGLDLVDVQKQYSTMIDYLSAQYSMIRRAIGK